MGTYTEYEGKPDATGMRLAIVAGRFNDDVTKLLLHGARQALAEHGLDADSVPVVWVPGAFEIPLVAKQLAEAGELDAVICLGAVIRGDTPHFDFVAGQCARGIAQVSLSEMLPVIFGVLTTNTQQQALDRIGGPHGHAGERAAEAAVEMVGLLHKIGR